jgi:hypothetical protein
MANFDDNGCALPETLKWHEYLVKPPYPDDPQDKVTTVLRMPGFYEPTDEDGDGGMCVGADGVGYHCLTHDEPWRPGGAYCPEHDHHEIAVICSAHGLETMSPQPIMLLNPEGFDPLLTEAQLAHFP